ncbi:hypothetical protein [Pseudomonas lopnurensis]|uniref:hypothetical protein n=1 Tax=Pseudomonas lopnurensis TaxID=1477517 RepID=UPI0028A6B405|nr:hypothetical protein [Pseudomonas lopnurensis]
MWVIAATTNRNQQLGELLVRQPRKLQRQRHTVSARCACVYQHALHRDIATVQLLVAASVHFGKGWSFTNANGGWEYPVFLAFTALALALLDDGAFALKRSVRN